MSHTIEILDVVSENDEVIGQIDRALLGLGKNPGFRVINAFLVNDQGQLWIPRRHANKKLFGLHLDTSVGGHVMSGETYEQALKREALEEVGLTINECSSIAKLTPHEDGVSAFMHVYMIPCNETPRYNQDDFCEWYWLKPSEVIDRLRRGDKGKGDLEIILKTVFPG